LLSVSIVKVVIVVVLCAARCAVMTWITPHGWERKAILNKLNDSEGMAMGHRIAGRQLGPRVR
jgi:hypothetical protein